MLISTNTTYYITDSGCNLIYILNDGWEQITTKSFKSPAYMATSSSNVYITGDFNIWKTDKDLNVLAQHNNTDNPNYRGVYYNSTNDLIYVADYSNLCIDIFDSSLKQVDVILTSYYTPWSVTGYNNRMYVGTSYMGKVLVIENKQIINIIDACNGLSDDVLSITFDQSGLMATSCYTGKLFLYNSDSTYSEKSIMTSSLPFSTAFDSKGRFIIVSYKQISIYC
jgi:hypothetical protein